jgi:hypothetical protein
MVAPVMVVWSPTLSAIRLRKFNILALPGPQMRGTGGTLIVV